MVRACSAVIGFVIFYLILHYWDWFCNISSRMFTKGHCKNFFLFEILNNEFWENYLDMSPKSKNPYLSQIFFANQFKSQQINVFQISN